MKRLMIAGTLMLILIVLWCIRDFWMQWIRERDLEYLLRLDGISDPMEIGRFEKKRQLKTMMVLGLLAAWPLVSYNRRYLLFVLGSAAFLYKQPYVRLKQKQKRFLAKLRQEFPLWLRQLQVLLQNHTVLKAMELSLARSPAILRPEIEDLIGKIQLDPLSLQPYLDFLKDHEIYEIQKAMKLLYRYHFVGAEESYQQFHRMIEATGKWLRQSRNDRQSSHLAMFQWLGMVPLFGVTVMFLVMMIIVILSMMKGGIG